MASPRKLAFGLLCLFAALIQGCLSKADENLTPDEQSVPEKLEHGEKGSIQYKVDNVKLTGSKHMDDSKGHRPPSWPPRPGRRSFIQMKAKKALPTIIRPGRSILDNLINKRNYQLSGPKIYRPGKRDIPNGPPSMLFRPGREDVPEGPPSLFRPGREDVPQAPSLFRPGRDDVPNAPPFLFRPGREDVSQHMFRPGRDDVPNAPPFLFRPGREDVPQNALFRPGRNNIPETQFHSVRAGRRGLGYKMPWTYVGSSVNSNVQHNSHTLRQKALEEMTKRAHDNQQEMSDPNSLLEEPQDF